MKGKYQLEIGNNRVKYELILERKVTVITGNSGTGKSTLAEMFNLVATKGNNLGYKCNYMDKIASISNEKKWRSEIEECKNKFIIIDESNRFIVTREFAEVVKNSNNYFIIISRSGNLGYLTYSVDSIYEMTSDEHNKPVINRLKKRYIDRQETVRPDLVITEDSNSGFEMFSSIFSCETIFAGGKDNVYNIIKKYKDRLSYVIVDGAAFGSAVLKCLRLKEQGYTFYLYTPESFEWILLHADYYKKYIDKELTDTYDYCDITKYLTWEQYFTALIVELTPKINSKQHYSKSSLNKFFLTKQFIEAVKNCLCDIDVSSFKEV